MRRVVAALGLFLGAPGAAAEPVTLSLAAADAMAAQALSAGQPRLAYDLSRGLLEADRRNPHAYYYQALALAQAGALAAGERKAARAYWHARTPEQRFQAAQLAARLSHADDRLTGSQFWLRRALDHAPDDVARADTITAYRAVRRRNPLHFNLRASVTPSDNVNNGASSPLNVIDGVPVVGTLSPAAQALSGVIASAHLTGSYRLARTPRRETRVTGRLHSRRVRLSDDVAGLSGGDLSSTTAEIGLRQLAAPGPAVTWRFDLGAGRAWFGGDPLYDFARIAAQRHHRLGARLSWAAGAGLEGQRDEAGLNADTTVTTGFAALGYRLGETGQLGLRLQVRETDSDGVNRSFTQWSAIASYSPAQALGPLALEVSLGASTLDYDRYRIGFIAVPGGRQDTSVFASVTATFATLGYMGFVPTLSLTRERSRSNISRFEVEETSLSLGIRSEF